jgi:hypothetical protein
LGTTTNWGKAMAEDKNLAGHGPTWTAGRRSGAGRTPRTDVPRTPEQAPLRPQGHRGPLRCLGQYLAQVDPGAVLPFRQGPLLDDYHGRYCWVHGGFGFSVKPPLPSRAWSWVMVGFLVDSEGFGELLCPEVGNLSYFR